MANTSKRGFASMDAAKQREIASKGGKAAHAKGTAHEFTSDEARVAGRKGGEAVSRDRAHMSAIGREGGHSRGARARSTQNTENTSAPTDFARNTAPQAFERPVANSDRPNQPQRSSFGSDRNSSSRNERDSRDSRDSNTPFSGRDEI
jgi:general stress protein YciG